MTDIGMLRLAAQRIAGPGMAGPGDAVRWLTAAQAQDHGGALASVALRTTSGSRAAVQAALDAGEIVKSWPMRGTLHLVAAEDLPWLVHLAAPRVVATTTARRAELGLDTKTIEYADQLARDALRGGIVLSRNELLAAWDAAGVSTVGQRGYSLLRHLAMTGVLCLGPGDQQVVLVEEWIPQPRVLDREEALGELALRYFRSHGPATGKDFTRWAHLVAADVRAGLAIARPDLASVTVDGVEYLMDPRTPEALAGCLRRARGVFLLPGFDEFILGYADRGAVVPAEYAARIVPGGNGVFQPTVVSAGRVVGTWKHAGRGARQTVAATPFESFTDAVATAIPRAYAALP
ncbi:winged helix DNA-binding domain-containing protein [Phytohabitans rumicis]|uniref:Winged helix DNA-binding domain-containing protein n=1 Tax=Phytohabitans rumicis TaxID=1076125 RepID=A0A6V8L624_9ACTN|nr:winged helix DNA-binding domain-containing protein [Phytohabitans rumicis]GFJ92693.1 hypothetical protein Prum_063350 [Phytohabitans rumicis]